jgi:hypothetical protein
MPPTSGGLGPLMIEVILFAAAFMVSDAPSENMFEQVEVTIAGLPS